MELIKIFIAGDFCPTLRVEKLAVEGKEALIFNDILADLNQSEEDVPSFTESRAKALLRASDVLDDPTLHDFLRLMENTTAVRIALYDLLESTDLALRAPIKRLFYQNSLSYQKT